MLYSDVVKGSIHAGIKPNSHLWFEQQGALEWYSKAENSGASHIRKFINVRSASIPFLIMERRCQRWQDARTTNTKLGCTRKL